MLVAVINFARKSWYNFSKLILVITRDNKIHIQYKAHLSQARRGSCWKDHQVESSIKRKDVCERTSWPEVLRQLGYGPVFNMCSNPINFCLTDGLM